MGHLQKSEVRRIAREAGLPNHAKRDSTGICFIGERPFREFLSRYLPREPGPMVTPQGERVGEHEGLMYYTIGQRQGLGIGGRRDGAGEPWYVAGKDPASNRLTVVQGHDHALLLRKEPRRRRRELGERRGAARRRRATPRRRAIARPTRRANCAPRARAFELDFAAPQWAVTPGQSAVLYRGDVCLGGG